MRKSKIAMVMAAGATLATDGFAYTINVGEAILQNQEDIGLLTSQTSTNSGSISVNSANISKNSADIAYILSVGSDRSLASINSSNIQTNSGNISINSGNIAVNSLNILIGQRNSELFCEQLGLLWDPQNNVCGSNWNNHAHTLAGRMSVNSSNIQTNSVNIWINSSNIRFNSGNISINSSNIQTNSSNIQVNTSTLEELQERVVTLEERLEEGSYPERFEYQWLQGRVLYRTHFVSYSPVIEQLTFGSDGQVAIRSIMNGNNYDDTYSIDAEGRLYFGGNSNEVSKIVCESSSKYLKTHLSLLDTGRIIDAELFFFDRASAMSLTGLLHGPVPFCRSW